MDTSYVKQLLTKGNYCFFNDDRSIYTDRMGPWDNQMIILAWEGWQDGSEESISITPDEVSFLFEIGMAKNVFKKEDGSLLQKWRYLDSRTFPGAIVCGIMAPSTAKEIRPQIIEYAKRMGYVTDQMTPVVMASGTKSLFPNDDGTYNVYYEWAQQVKKIDRGVLERYTRYFFSSEEVEILENGVLIKNLSEEDVFSRGHIDHLRVYDIHLKYLDPQIDKTILMKAAVQVACIDMPINILNYVTFKRKWLTEIPVDKVAPLTFDEYDKLKMECGTLHHYSDNQGEEYNYKINVPYSECVRELLCDVEAVVKARYKDKYGAFVFFSKFRENFSISISQSNKIKDAEETFIGIDYALTILRDAANFNSSLFFDSIFSLLEADSSGYFREKYFAYINEVKKALPEKIDFM